jgi:hypothetical protein
MGIRTQNLLCATSFAASSRLEISLDCMYVHSKHIMSVFWVFLVNFLRLLLKSITSSEPAIYVHTNLTRDWCFWKCLRQKWQNIGVFLSQSTADLCQNCISTFFLRKTPIYCAQNWQISRKWVTKNNIDPGLTLLTANLEHAKLPKDLHS